MGCRLADEEIAAKGVQDMHASSAAAVNSVAATLPRKIQWVIAKGEVLGWIEELPEDVVADIPVSQWEIRSLTLRWGGAPQAGTRYSAPAAAGSWRGMQDRRRR